MGILSNNKNVRSFNEVQYLRKLEQLDLSGDFNMQGDLPMSNLQYLQKVNVEGTELDLTLPSTSTLTEVKYGCPTKVVIPDGTSVTSSNLTIENAFNLKEIDINNVSGGISKLLGILENRAIYNSLSNTLIPTFNYTVKNRQLEFTFNFNTNHEIIISETDNNEFILSKFNKTITLNSTKYINTSKQFISLEFYDTTDHTKGILTFCINLYDYLNHTANSTLSKLIELENAGLNMSDIAINSNDVDIYCSNINFDTLKLYPTLNTISLIGK